MADMVQGGAIAALTVALLGLAGAARAADTFTPPAGCTAYVTMQKRDCVVTHLYTCTGDPPGQQWRVDIEADGPSFFSAIDAETQWIESHHLLAGRTEWLLPGAPDPASLSELIATGVDTYDFTTRDSLGYETRFTGTDRLTGEQVTIDGVTLDRTRFEAVATDVATGEQVWTVEGSEFVQRDWRSFVSGVSRYTLPGESYDSDRTPVEFHFPEEEGFLSANPKYDCGLMLSLGPSSLGSL